VASRHRYQALEFTEVFLEDLVSQDFSTADRRRFVRALRLLDADDKHPSLRVHELQGPLAGIWSASASDQLRMTFERLAGGRKLMLTCSRHYQR
jgi:mRNA-degrading endonuclease YafQ of YafQ-DinJ toxin-antitoxin module